MFPAVIIAISSAFVGSTFVGGSTFGVRSSAFEVGAAGPSQEPPQQGPPQQERSTQEPTNREPTNAEPATFWCPMHPNVRGASVAEKCNECGMSLVAIPDRTEVSYWLDVATTPAAVRVGRPLTLRLTVRDLATNEAVSHFDEMHERLLHLFIVSSDLGYFDHVHPVPAQDGSFEIPLTLPHAGAYRLVADLLPTGGTPQTLQHTLLVGGKPVAAPPPPAEPRAEVLEAAEGDVRARLVTAGARTGDDAHLVVELTGQDGVAVTDVEPYLGAWGHMFLASEDLADVVHSHPLLEETKPGGPTITFQTLFARSGWYRVWTQVQRRGRLLTFEFTVRVAPAL